MKRKLLAVAVTLLALAVILRVLTPQGPPKDYPAVSWEALGSWTFKQSQPLPRDVLKLNGQKVHLKGFMLPVEFSGRTVRTFILSRDQNACCFGIMPAFNQWVFVRMAPNHSAQVTMDRPILVWGDLSVGEEKKNGTLTSLYRLEAVSLAAPK